MSESSQSVIIDNGSLFCKAGVSKDSEPNHSFYTCIGYEKQSESNAKKEEEDVENKMEIEEKNEQKYVFGQDAQKRANEININYPIREGIVQNWDDMERIWDNFFDNILKESSSTYPCMMTETPMNPNKNREKMAELAFEKYQFNKFTLQNASQLALYSTGKTAGMIIDLGDTVSTVVPIYEGNMIQYLMKRYKIAGKQLTEYLRTLLNQQEGVNIEDTQYNHEVLRGIKEQYCYFTKNYEQESQIYQDEKNKIKSHKLPDGTNIQLDDFRIKVPEYLFNPRLQGPTQLQGIHGVVFQSAMQCDIDTRKEIMQNVLICGGVSLTDGFSDRMQHELMSLFPPSVKVKCVTVQDRLHNAWQGGSILCSLGSFQQHFITKQDYEEYGNQIIHRKGY